MARVTAQDRALVAAYGDALPQLQALIWRAGGALKAKREHDREAKRRAYREARDARLNPMPHEEAGEVVGSPLDAASAAYTFAVLLPRFRSVRAEFYVALTGALWALLYAMHRAAIGRDYTDAVTTCRAMVGAAMQTVRR